FSIGDFRFKRNAQNQSAIVLTRSNSLAKSRLNHWRSGAYDGSRGQGQTVMERTIFLQHYRVRLRSGGTPRELSRDDAAITYEAVDERSGDPVDLKLIPVETIDSGVREQLEEQARAAQML